jgi:8-oxo-dGTP diphosphatase
MKNPRLRVCGIVLSGESLVLVRHKRAIDSVEFPESYWIVPGGGVELGETLAEAVLREVKEESGFVVDVKKMLFVREFIYPLHPTDKSLTQFHAIEIYFHCVLTDGTLTHGHDPELIEQIVLETKLIPLSELDNLAIYPQFLKAFVRQHAATHFANVTPDCMGCVE